MLKNYFKIAIRNLWKHKGFSTINIVGLSVGMTCAILILLWIQDELSFDKFHKNSDNIYLVLRSDSRNKTAVTSILLADKLKEELPEVVNSTSLMPIPENMSFLIRNGNTSFNETVGIAAPNFFKMFSFNFRKGNPSAALADPNSIIITGEKAKKYFGNDDAIGKSLSVTAFGSKFDMKVCGILENIPSNSHLQCQIFIPTSWFKSFITKNVGSNFNFWDNQSSQTYIQLINSCDIQELTSKIKTCELKYQPTQNPETLSYSLLPLTKIHLYGNRISFLRAETGDIKYVQIFFIIAIIILVIASINYMNLSTALSLKRAKEVAVRKTFGANRKTLLLQFFGESLFLSFVALSFAILLVELLLPEFNHLSGKKLAIRLNEPYFICITFLITSVTGLISGSYPALFLSSFQPIQILKDKLKLGFGSLIARKGLVIFQFALSVIIIICTVVVMSQLSFIKNSNLGFDKENIICIQMTGEANSKYEILKNELNKNQDILCLSRSESINSDAWSNTSGVYWKGKQDKEEKQFWQMSTDCDLATTFKIEMSQGRFFSNKFITDQTNAFVINEAAARSMNMKSPLNEEIILNGKKGLIIGVTKDFHFSSFHNAIEPLIITIPRIEQQNLYYRVMAIRVKPRSLNNCIAYIEKIWKEQIPNISFNYYFYDESLNAQYAAEHRMSAIFNYFSLLSILISCLGLFGLASLSAEKRTKEIGIRKVLGATTTNISLILSREFLIWIIVANVIAWPVAYYFINKWLQDFAYRINISLWMFVLSGCLALMIALLTVSWQAIRAARSNPVDSLKYE